MSWLDNRVPPPVLTLISGALIWALSRAMAPFPASMAWRLLLGAPFIAAGALLDAVSFLHFRRARTTINPLKPSATTALVATGIYRRTRNPMYVGLVAILVGWSLLVGAPLGLSVVVVFAAYLTRFQIEPEERALRTKLGKSFEDYMRGTPRWL